MKPLFSSVNSLRFRCLRCASNRQLRRSRHPAFTPGAPANHRSEAASAAKKRDYSSTFSDTQIRPAANTRIHATRGPHPPTQHRRKPRLARLSVRSPRVSDGGPPPPGAPRAVSGRGSSTVLEGGLALLDERGHPLLLVLGGEQRVEDASLEQDAFGQRGLVGAVDRLLRDHHGRERELRDR